MTDAEVTRWLAERARPLAGAEPDDGVAAWTRAVGDARVVALGPAVGGTRELGQLAHRMLDGLIGAGGVCTLALQAGESVTTVLDDHVRGGTGSPAEALETLGSWNTREVLDVVRAIAGRNRACSPGDAIRIVGVDPRRPAPAVRVVGAFLRAAAPEALPPVAGVLADLALGRGDDATRAAVERVRARLEHDRAALVAATSPAQHDEALRHAGFLARAAELTATPRVRADAVAGRLMAEAVLEAAVDVAPAGGRVVFWAHVDHVVVRDDPPTAGAHLREGLGDGYRALVLSAGAGALRAIRRRRLFGPARTPSTHRLPALPAGTLEGVLLAACAQDHLLDLRVDDAPAAVRTWADTPSPRRSVGDEVSATAPAGATVPCRPAAELDGFAVVRTVHPAGAR